MAEYGPAKVTARYKIDVLFQCDAVVSPLLERLAVSRRRQVLLVFKMISLTEVLQAVFAGVFHKLVKINREIDLAQFVMIGLRLRPLHQVTHCFFEHPSMEVGFEMKLRQIIRQSKGLLEASQGCLRMANVETKHGADHVPHVAAWITIVAYIGKALRRQV